MDPITDLFLITQVASVVHARLEATAPWSLKREAHSDEGTAKHSVQPATPWRCDLTPGTPRVRNGYYELPTGPGWGVEVDKNLMRAHPENPDAKLNMFSVGWEERMCK